MVIYEVNLDVESAIFSEYRAWLDEHVRAMLALPGFSSAQVFERREPAPEIARRSLCVHYRLANLDELDRYLREHAPRMRADGERRFGGRFSASRRVLIAAD